MRFMADGPDIPDELLVARDAGNVILFCGAGVSQQEARLPSFAGLARKVIETLGTAQDSRSRVLLERALSLDPMPGVGGLVATDKVFGLLEQEFEISDVRSAVAEAIRPTPDVRLDAHRLLLDLATIHNGGLDRVEIIGPRIGTGPALGVSSTAYALPAGLVLAVGRHAGAAG